MDTKAILENFGKEEQRKFDEIKMRRKTLQDNLDFLEGFPEFDDKEALIEISPSYYSPDFLNISIFPQNIKENPGQSTEIRRKIQDYVRVIAKRNFNQYDGSVSFQFEIRKEGDLRVSITMFNGEHAPGCQIEQVTETVTRFKMTCPESVES